MIVHQPNRVKVPFFTYGTLVLLGFIAVGCTFGLTRFITGIGTVTNLDNHNPWGIWIAFDVACGVALAAGGFTTAALVDIFGRKRYHSLLRPAILTALLGYLWVAVALLFDLGRYWNIWRPVFNWQGNSVLFEVAMCVMFYLFVLSVEMSPAIFEGLTERMEGNRFGAALLRRLRRPVGLAYTAVRTALPIFILAGVVLSCMHQSSLGSLMLIAPTKVNPLWYTPILPVEFILSAIMVGYPMVIMESIIAGVSFDRDPEMDVLGPLARIIPWFLGLYGLVKFGDLFVRRAELNFVASPGPTIALAVELTMGIVAPFILLCIRGVRRSVGWLFFSAMLIIFGVIMNRINVFLVGYDPPYLTKAYFPSLGEISLTIAIICSIMFVYRFFVIFFPVLPGVRDTASLLTPPPVTVKPMLTWVFRGSAAVFLLAFVVLYTLVHRQAITASLRAYRVVQSAHAQRVAPATQALFAHANRPAAYQNLYILDSPVLARSSEDYEPVRFSHRTHDVNSGGDCSVCHHRFASKPDDRIGEDLKTLHAGNDARLGGPCASCHKDMREKRQQSCRRCHGLPIEADDTSRLGLKGAYHRQCIGCHAQQPSGANAPTDCGGCHHPEVPRHDGLVQLAAVTEPRQVTAQCLRCHEGPASDVLQSAHWNWRGGTPAIAGREHRIDLGLKDHFDNYLISMPPNLAALAAFHVGYNRLTDEPGGVLAQEIDCLVCHDTTKTYRKGADGLPEAGADLAAMARKVGRPGPANCGSCHFYDGGGPNVRHGDLEPQFLKPGNTQDIHLGLLEMRCQDCHKTASHRIAGRSFASPMAEGKSTCESCHGYRPHGISGFLSRHLDQHVKGVACETCHIPSFAREAPTRLGTDFSVAGQERAPKPDANGMPDYDKRLGALTWGRNVTPVYRWFDGSRESHTLGEKIDPQKPVPINQALGERQDPKARIFPFKVHVATLPYDAERRTLVAPLLPDGYWKTFDWNAAVTTGMAQRGRPYSGKLGWVKTEMYSSIHHEVVPAKQALGCTDCHRHEAVTCQRCHKRAAGMDEPQHMRPTYPEVKSRLDFKALGYDDDPAMIGSRFYLHLGRGTPPD